MLWFILFYLQPHVSDHTKYNDIGEAHIEAEKHPEINELEVGSGWGACEHICA